MIEWKKYKKEDLERIKLSKEINNIDQPFVIKNFSAIVALIIGIFSVSIGVYTGLFDVKKESLQIQKETLKIEVDAFTKRKDSLQIQSTALLNLIDNKQQKLDSILGEFSTKEIQFKELKQSYESLNSTYTNLKKVADEPMLSLSKMFMVTDIGPGFILKNSGSTAIIDEYRVYLKGKCLIVNSKDKRALVRSLLGIENEYFTSLSYSPGDKISNREQVVLIGVNRVLVNNEKIRQLEYLEDQVGFLIKYHSISGKKDEKYFGPIELKIGICN